MKAKGIMIDTKVYAAINTTEYNNDGNCCIQSARGLDGCAELGWEEHELGINLRTHEMIEVKDMEVGDVIESVYYLGAYLMRVA